MSQRTRYCSRCLMTFVVDLEQCPNLSCRYARPGNGWGELLEAGDVIDRNYRVLQRLAIGGAGVTYQARELDASGEEAGPKVAIKVLYQQRDQGSYLRRLATEAQIIQGLNHPSIVEYRGFVHRAGHSPYLITRYEAGGSLLDHIRRVGILPVPVVAAIGKQVCSALSVAHSQGIVHRDLKPENVLLEKQVGLEDVPKIRVADFGIAKVAGGFGEKLTQVGAFVGTPQFAAPEQFEGAQPEPATDVYATGAMLYFCLVGKPVAGHMDALEPDQQLEHLLNHLPPKLVIPEGADSEETNELQKLEAVFTRAMAPYPNERCTMAELERSLGELIPGHITHDTSTGSFTREQQSLSKTSCPPNLSKLPVDSRPPTDSRPPDIRESRTPENRRKVEGSSNLGCGLLTVGGMLAGAVLVLLLVSGWWYYTQEDSEPVLLSGTDTDPDKKAEWELITASLRLPAINAIRSCKGPKKFQLDIIYDEKGTLQTLTLIGNTDEVLRSCVANQLLPVMVPRSSDGSVRLTFSL